MNFEVLNAHVCKLTSYLLKARICLLVYLGIDPLNSFLSVGIQGVAFRAAYVAAPVKTVYSKLSVLKKVRLSVQTVHMEATGIIINSKKRRTRESGFKDLEGIQLWKMHNHPKVDYTKLPPLDDLQACSESSKSGLYKRSNFGRCIIIQKWIVQNFHLWMIYKHAQNHPKVDCTKDPILEDA